MLSIILGAVDAKMNKITTLTLRDVHSGDNFSTRWYLLKNRKEKKRKVGKAADQSEILRNSAWRKRIYQSFHLANLTLWLYHVCICECNIHNSMSYSILSSGQ